MLEDYNSEFAAAYDEEANALNYSEAQLECVIAEPKIGGWEERVFPAPNPEMEALAIELFERIKTGISLCKEAETLGDWREVNNTLGSLQEVVDRLDAEAFGG